MKILILSVNRTRTPLPVIPIGACMAADAASKAGHEVGFLDFMFQRNPLKALRAKLKTFEPQAIGISVRNIDNNDMRNPVLFTEELLPVMEEIHDYAKIPVILGGAAISIMPEEILKYTGASYAVTGDAFSSFPRLLECLSHGKVPDDVPGVSWLENGRYLENNDYVNDTTELCLVPDYQRWINLRAYQTNLTAIPVKTKTGCNFKCVYCTYDIIDGGQEGRLAEPRAVAEAVKRQVELGFKDMEFVDNVFNFPYDHAMSICEEIIKSGVKARLQSLEINPKYLDDPLLTAMEMAGFNGIGITVESASDTVLSRFEKGFAAEDVFKAAQAVARHKIPCMWFFMLGGPGETNATVQETLSFAREFIRPEDVAYFTIGIRLYPGTKLQKIAEEQGLLPKNSMRLLDPVFYVSPEVDKQWMIEELQTTVRSQSNFIIAGEVSSPLMPAIYRLGYTLGVRSPLWKHTHLLRKGLNILSTTRRS